MPEKIRSGLSFSAPYVPKGKFQRHDSTENPFGKFNRHVDKSHAISSLQKKIAGLYEIPKEYVNFCNDGAAGAIRALTQLFCDPTDTIITCPPTFPLYGSEANLQSLLHREIPLDDNFDLAVEKIIDQGQESKIIFLPNPNNPTGNCFSHDRIEKILKNHDGIMVIDEAAIQYSNKPSLVKLLSDHPRLVVLQSFSKFFGLVQARLGMIFAHPDIQKSLNEKILFPINTFSIRTAEEQLQNINRLKKERNLIVRGREMLSEFSLTLSYIKKVYPSDANYFLAEVEKYPEFDIEKLLQTLRNQHDILLANVSYMKGLENHIQVTVGTEEENAKLIKTFDSIQYKNP